MLLAHGLLVLAMDGSRMQLLRNHGTEAKPEREVIATEHHSHHGNGSHDKQEQKFAAEALARLSRADPKAPLVLIAPPRMLGHLRAAASGGLERRIVASFHHDHAQESPAQICHFLINEKP